MTSLSLTEDDRQKCESALSTLTGLLETPFNNVFMTQDIKSCILTLNNKIYKQITQNKNIYNNINLNNITNDEINKMLNQIDDDTNITSNNNNVCYIIYILKCLFF